MGDGDKIRYLKRLRKILIGVFSAFIIIPLIFGPLLFINFEKNSNSEFSTYENAFLYNYGIVIGTELTNSTVSTIESKIVVGAFSLLNLIFFGFIAAIITTTIEIKLNSQKSSRNL